MYARSDTCHDDNYCINEMWVYSQLRPFLSYGQCPVPRCPDKGSLSVYTNVHTYLHTMHRHALCTHIRTYVCMYPTECCSNSTECGSSNTVHKPNAVQLVLKDTQFCIHHQRDHTYLLSVLVDTMILNKMYCT